jgi:mRNA interferase RelE/StbE
MTRCRVRILPDALAEIDRLPGHVRGRVRRSIMALREDQQPPQSKQLDYELGHAQEVWRLRIDKWRLVYLVDRDWHGIFVLTVRRRPPYNYDNLDALVEETDQDRLSF